MEELKEENKSLKNELMEDMKTETKLNEEIKKLKSDLGTVIDERDNAFKKIEQLREDLAYERTMLAFKNTMLDNVKAEYESSQDVIKKLEEENRLLKNEIAWLKGHTRYNGVTEEYYIDGTITATEAKLRLQQAEANQNYVSKLEERIRFLEQCLDNKEKVNKQLREEIKELNKMMLFETKI